MFYSFTSMILGMSIFVFMYLLCGPFTNLPILLFIVILLFSCFEYFYDFNKFLFIL